MEGYGIVPLILEYVRPNLEHSSDLPRSDLPSSGKTWKIGGSPVTSHEDDQSVGEVGRGRKAAELGCLQPREDLTSLAIPTR